MVVSDHFPCTADLKLMEAGYFLQAWGGIASLQFGRSLEGGGLSLPYQTTPSVITNTNTFISGKRKHIHCVHTHP